MSLPGSSAAKSRVPKSPSQKKSRQQRRAMFMEALEDRQLLAIAVAETLLVSLDARDASAGTAAWTNTGTLGGTFTEVGNPLLVTRGPIANPAVSFNEGVTQDAYRGANAPIGLTGAGVAGTRSIEVWVFNPAVAGEETLVSLARRGGGDGTNVSFNYGSNAAFGAVGQWGAPDLGWNGTPAAGQWHHLVYTYDGTTTRVYSDGLLKNTEVVGTDPHDAINMLIGAQMQANGTSIEFGGTQGT